MPKQNKTVKKQLSESILIKMYLQLSYFWWNKEKDINKDHKTIGKMGQIWSKRTHFNM